MTQKCEKLIQILKQLGDAISCFNLNEKEAWENSRTDLLQMIPEVPENIPEVKRVLLLCAEGLEAVSKKSASNRLSLVDAISSALHASEEYLLHKPYRDMLINEASQKLAGVLGCHLEPKEPAEKKRSEKAVAPEESPDVTLDDIAAFSVQLEPNDHTGLINLQKLLMTLTTNQVYPEIVCEDLSLAVLKLDELIAGNVSDQPTAFSEVGKVIEKAVKTMVMCSRAEGEELEQTPIPVKDTADATNNDEALSEGPIPDTNAEDIPNNDLSTTFMPEDADPDIIDEFIAESDDLVANAEEALLLLESDPENMDAVGTVFRAFHTIKGNAAFLDLTLLSEMAHHAESLLSKVRDGEISYTGEYAELALRSIDMFKEILMSVREALGGEPLLKPSGYNELMGLLDRSESSDCAEALNDASGTPPRIGDILVSEGKAKRDKIEDAAATQGNQPIGVNIIKTKAASLTDVVQAIQTQKKIRDSQSMGESSLRVRTDRLDRLIDMVGELVIAHSMVAQDTSIVSGNNHDLLKKINHTSKIARELQDLSMSMRMVPLKPTFQKIARLVRDLANKAGKSVSLVTDGEDTEIDRNMVDLISDPLVHMVRNAIDHGIESLLEREKAAKPENGTVSLSAYHSAGSVVVEIQDDGCGLNCEAILAKARERGLVNDADVLSDQEAFNLIFEPGFSTAKNITDVSGRGVGMDVVKRNIEALRGHIEIQSELGKGSTFKIRLPLTLAIIDGMVVRVGLERYIIPTISIVRSIQPKSKELSTIMQNSEIFSLGENLIPLFRLANLFHIDDALKDPTKALLVVVEENGVQAALLVDELLGQQQIVIKSLGETMENIEGVSGGAIMGDGRISLILDIGGIVKLANEKYEAEIKKAV